jgi:hypothetical protein
MRFSYNQANLSSIYLLMYNILYCGMEVLTDV